MNKMKKLFATLLVLASTQAHAVDILSQKEWDKTPAQEQAFCLNNEAGGYIIATSVPYAGDSKALGVISTTRSGKVITGKWAVYGKSTVIITWDKSGEKTVFNTGDFQLCRL